MIRGKVFFSNIYINNGYTKKKIVLKANKRNDKYKTIICSNRMTSINYEDLYQLNKLIDMMTIIKILDNI